MRLALLALVAALLAGCGSIAENPKAKENQEWWDKFYGTHKSDEKKQDEAVCQFYNNCPEPKGGLW